MASIDHGNHSVGRNTLLEAGAADAKKLPSPPAAACSSAGPAKVALSIAKHSSPKMMRTIPIAEKKARHMVAGRIMVLSAGLLGEDSYLGGRASDDAPNRPIGTASSKSRENLGQRGGILEPWRSFSENLSFSEGPVRVLQIEFLAGLV